MLYLSKQDIWNIFVILLVVVAIAVIIGVVSIAEQNVHYEYIDSDGKTHRANYCEVPYRGQARCVKDGETILDIKSFRRVQSNE